MMEKKGTSVLTVTSMIAFQNYGDQPVGFQSQLSNVLETTEQLFVRKLQLTNDKWHLVEKGWITSVSHIVIANNHILDLNVYPTQLQLEEYKSHKIFISFDGGKHSHLEVDPDTHQVLKPVDGNIYIRGSVKQPTACEIVVIPKEDSHG